MRCYHWPIVCCWYACFILGVITFKGDCQFLWRRSPVSRLYLGWGMWGVVWFPHNLVSCFCSSTGWYWYSAYSFQWHIFFLFLDLGFWYLALCLHIFHAFCSICSLDCNPAVLQIFLCSFCFSFCLFSLVILLDLEF